MNKLILGKVIYYIYDEFDGSGKIKCIITEIHDDHFIAVDETGTKFWGEESDIGDSFTFD